jgi:integrase
MIKIKPNHFIGMMGSRTIIKRNGIKCSIRNNRHRFMYPDEWLAFYDQLKPRQKITFHFLINTGARINEVRMIQVSDVDFDRNSIVLRWTKGRMGDGTRKMRVLSVSSQFIKWIRTVIKEYNLKPEDHFPILSTPAGNICMKKTLKEIGIQDWSMFSIHNVRKTLETWLISLDIDSLKIIKHFGHTMNIAAKFYVSSDTFNYEDKQIIRQVIGDLYQQQRGF